MGGWRGGGGGGGISGADQEGGHTYAGIGGVPLSMRA